MAVVGVGMDLVEVDRAALLLEHHGDRALQRFLLPAERAYVKTMAHPARHFAVRLAAKEAAYKALSRLRGATAIAWRDIEVARDRRGRPSIIFHGKADEVASGAGRYRVSVSLTHTALTAGAVVLIEV